MLDVLQWGYVTDGYIFVPTTSWKYMYIEEFYTVMYICAKCVHQACACRQAGVRCTPFCKFKNRNVKIILYEIIFLI
jgi:hypothetical protein